MKTIGLLGGMSWESTIPYYRLINEGVIPPAISRKDLKTAMRSVAVSFYRGVRT